MSGSDLVSPKEIAEALGKTVRFINMKATKEGWKAETVNKRGDRRFYMDGLPEYARMALTVRALAKKPPDCPSLEDARPVPVGSPELAHSTGSGLAGWQIRKASAWADLLRLYLEYVRRKANGHGSRMKAKKDFVRAYNAKAYPAIFEILGKTSWQTLERQVSKVKKEKDPFTALAPRHGGHKGKRSVGHEQAEVLLSIVRSPYQPKKKTEIIRIARDVMEQKGVDAGASDATYRRFLDDWISTNYDQWIFWREGERGLHNKCLFWIKRDYNRIDVGDILVADGHTLNFETLNPWTGKPKRMTLILWYDMKSNFPCGWEIMPTENTQAISAALRRAILMLGKTPKIAYLDNGKAFASRFFNGMNLEEAGLSGVFERLNIRPIYAWPYHGQSKTVERFFETFAELERIAPSYVGTSIAEKPPRLFMGEKLHRRIHDKITGGNVPTLEDTHRAVAAWFEIYVRRPQRDGHLKGQRPVDVFSQGQGPGVNPVELRELMMSVEIRTIRRRGIRFLGEWYYSPALYGRKHPVIIKYDLQDNRSLFVYRGKEFICEARRISDVHPAADILGTEEDQAMFRDQLGMKKSLEKRTVSGARELLNTVIIPETTRQIESAGFVLKQGGGSKEEGKKKVKELPLAEEDKARIEAEYEALDKHNQAMEHIAWENLHTLNDMDRYEKLLEYEAQGVMVPRDEQGFMRYFEQTEQYTRFADYFEEFRTKMVMMYQA